MFKYFLHKRRAGKNSKINNLYVDRKKNFMKIGSLLIPALIVIIVFTIIPFINSASNSFEYLPNKHDKTQTAIGTQNWTHLLNDPFFITSVRNSMLYAFISVPLVIVISAIISGVLAHIGRKWLRGIFQTLFFLPYVTSGVAISLAFAFIFDFDAGLLNSIFGTKVPWLVGDAKGFDALKAMLIFGTWRGLAFNVLIFTTAMLGVDKTLYKSASIDGAGGMRQFFSITLPATKRTLSFLITMGIIGAIKVFPLALFQNQPAEAMMHGGGTLLLYVYSAVHDGDMQMAAVSSIVLLLISVSFSVVFINGFNGLIKGINYIGDRNVANKIKIKTLMK